MHEATLVLVEPEFLLTVFVLVSPVKSTSIFENGVLLNSCSSVCILGRLNLTLKVNVLVDRCQVTRCVIYSSLCFSKHLFGGFIIAPLTKEQVFSIKEGCPLVLTCSLKRDAHGIVREEGATGLPSQIN